MTLYIKQVRAVAFLDPPKMGDRRIPKRKQ